MAGGQAAHLACSHIPQELRLFWLPPPSRHSPASAPEGWGISESNSWDASTPSPQHICWVPEIRERVGQNGLCL